MSDLDADLYGGEIFFIFYFGCSVMSNSCVLDLYGNDEGGEEQQPREENDTQQQSPVTEAPIEPPQVTNSIPVVTEDTSLQYLQQQTPQKIPTYEEPQPSEYREPQQIRSDGIYQSIPVNERSVRPSEMKDEG